MSMIRIRNTSDGPISVGGVRLDARGDIGMVDPGKPGVKMLRDAGRIAFLDDAPAAESASIAAELRDARAELARLKTQADADAATIGALQASVAGLSGGDDAAKMRKALAASSTEMAEMRREFDRSYGALREELDKATAMLSQVRADRDDLAARLEVAEKAAAAAMEAATAPASAASAEAPASPEKASSVTSEKAPKAKGNG